jgi:hypothetical protein
MCQPLACFSLYAQEPARYDRYAGFDGYARYAWQVLSGSNPYRAYLPNPADLW